VAVQPSLVFSLISTPCDKQLKMFFYFPQTAKAPRHQRASTVRQDRMSVTLRSRGETTNMDVDSANDLDGVWTQVDVRASASSSASDNGDDDDASSLVVISRSACWIPIPCDY
jgi:hypothetical protein